jgi:hypothetical protein
MPKTPEGIITCIFVFFVFALWMPISNSYISCHIGAKVKLFVAIQRKA